MKKSKKIFSILLILSMMLNIFSTAPIAKAAGENLTINPALISASINQADLVVPIYVNNVANLRNVEFDLNYDSTYLEYTGYKDLDIGDFSKLGCDQNPRYDVPSGTPGPVRVIVSRGSCGEVNVVAEQKVVGLHFRVLSNTGTTSLTLTNVALKDINSSTIAGITSLGSELTIVAPTPEITISTETATVGGDVLVKISATGLVDAKSIGLQINYDYSILTHVNTPTPSTVLDLAMWDVVVDEFASGTLDVFADGFFGTPASGNIDIVTLKFTATSTGTSNLSITPENGFETFLEDSSGQVTANWNDGAVVVSVPVVIPTPEITISTETATVGGDVLVKISATGLVDAKSIGLQINYDYSILTHVNTPTPSTVLDLAMWDVVVDEFASGTLDVFADGFFGTPASGNIDIVTLKFTATSTGTSNLSIAPENGFETFLEDSSGQVTANWNDGAVVVSAPADTTAPIITLIGSSTINLIVGDVYSDLGATASDDTDGDISLNINTVNPVNTSTAGTYTVTYNVSDLALNPAIEVTRTVVVTAPDIISPIRSNKAPITAQVVGTTETTISLTTDENATCKYSTTAGTTYASSTNTFLTTGSTSHSTLVSGLSNGNTFHYYVRCEDASANSNIDDYDISFSISNPVSTGGGGGGGGGGGYSSADTMAPSQVQGISALRKDNEVILKWTNPSDNDLKGILVIRLESKVDSFITATAARQLGTEIYDGMLETITDSAIENNLTYYYLVYTYDEVPNYSKAIIMKNSAILKDDNIGINDNSQNDNTPTDSNTVKYNNLGGLASSIVEEVSGNEAKTIFQFNKFVDMDAKYIKLYNKVVSEIENNQLSDESKYSIAFFIRYGSDTTIVLGAGERAGVVNSYKSVFSKLPQTEDEWKDIVKIANGRWPSEQNISAEQKAQAEIFKTIYKREANMNNANDNAAVTVITYGLRPANRNMDSEKAGIKIFRGIFGYSPSSASDWDIVRAISYSGATR